VEKSRLRVRKGNRKGTRWSPSAQRASHREDISYPSWVKKKKKIAAEVIALGNNQERIDSGGKKAYEENASAQLGGGGTLLRLGGPSLEM